MVISLHSHSGEFCKHARGTLEEVVLKAIEMGFHTFGLSEHMPRYRTKDLYPEESSMSPEELSEVFERYVAEGRRLQAKYQGQIHLLVGAETENIYGGSLGQVEELRRRHRLDYLVCSVHHVGEIPIDFSQELYDEAAAAHGGLEGLFKAYFDLQLEALEQLRPEVLGHLDLIILFAPEGEAEGLLLREEVWQRIVRNVRRAVELGALFELNASAFRKGLPGAYPCRPIVQEIVRQGGRFTLSDDSHGPGAVGLNYRLLGKYLSDLEITEVYTLRRDAEAGTLEQVKLTPEQLKLVPKLNQ